MSDSNTPEGTALNDGNINEAEAHALGQLFLNPDDEADQANPKPDDEDVEDEPLEAQDDADQPEEEDEAELQADDEENEYEPIDDLSALVKLPDGTEVSIKELHEGNMRQADYTRKRQEDAALKQELQSNLEQTRELEQTLVNERQQMATVLQQFMPEPPDPALMHEYPGVYLQQKEQYEAAQNAVRGALQGNQVASQRQMEEMQKRDAETLNREAEAMFQAMPELRDPETYRQFAQNTSTALVNDYGFTEAEIAGLADHRMMRVVKDAIEFRKLKGSTQQTKKKLEGKKPVMNGRRRKANTSARDNIEKRIAAAQKAGDASSVSDILGKLLTS